MAGKTIKKTLKTNIPGKLKDPIEFKKNRRIPILIIVNFNRNKFVLDIIVIPHLHHCISQ